VVVVGEEEAVEEGGQVGGGVGDCFGGWDGADVGEEGVGGRFSCGRRGSASVKEAWVEPRRRSWRDQA